MQNSSLRGNIFVDFLRDESHPIGRTPDARCGTAEQDKKHYVVIGFEQDILMLTFFLSIAYPKRKYAFRIN
jgi:hypothetical protein